jgi:L-alanine-DL-glutamate epimerase-like enolase superfamily enzyme
VGTHPEDDCRRVQAARKAAGAGRELFVDANGALSRKQALAFAERFSESGVSWFEEPVSSDDLEGLRLIRDRGPAGMDVTAGEYGYDLAYFRRMLEAGAVDVLQADASRCGGITGFLRAASLCEAAGVPMSSHCAPALHLAVCAAVPALRHMEYFHDHVRIERMLFDGFPELVAGELHPDRARPGLGLEFREADARAYAL